MMYDHTDGMTYCLVTQTNPTKPNDPQPFFGSLRFSTDIAMFTPKGENYKVAFGSEVNSILLTDQKVIIFSVHTEK